MVKEKNKEGIVKSIVKTVSYDTGILFRKAKNIGKITETEPWEKVVSGTQGLYQTVGEKTRVILKKVNKSVTKNVGDLKESFKEGIESVGEEEASGTKTSSRSVHSKSVSVHTKVPASRSRAKATCKGGMKKVAQKTPRKKEAPVNAAMEEEIEALTKDVEDIS